MKRSSLFVRRRGYKIFNLETRIVDVGQLTAWRDLTDASVRKTTLEKFLSVVEEMSSVVAKMSTSTSVMKNDVGDDDEDDDASSRRKSATEKKEKEKNEPTLIVTQNICKFNTFLSMHVCICTHIFTYLHIYSHIYVYMYN